MITVASAQAGKKHKKKDSDEDDETSDKSEKTDKADKKDKKHDLDDKLSFGGRVFVRGAVARVDDGAFTAQDSIPSGRVKAVYEWEELQAELEVELTSHKLKNAFLQLRVLDGAQKIDVEAGQFKMPFSAIQQTSGWTLPTADRGLIDSVLVNRLQVAGRRVGADVEVKLGGPVKPKLTAGMFQGTDDAENPLAVGASTGFGQDGVVRATVEPVDGLEIGASGEVRSGEMLVLPAVVRHRWAADLDVTVERGGLRAWAEGYAGSSWLVAGTTPGHTKAIFAGGRAIASYRFGGEKKTDCYVEPYLLLGAIDPDSSFGNDLVVEATGGVGYGAWDVWRLQAEIEVWRIGANAPPSIAAFGALNPSDTTTFLLQAGAHF